MQILFNKSLFKEQIKRFWVLSAITVVIYLLFIIMPLFNEHNYNNMLYDLVSLIYMENPILLASTIILPLVVVGMLFSYLFQQRASITILSYPIKRDSLWFTNVVSGFVLIIIPVLILSIIIFMLLSNFNLGNIPIDIYNYRIPGYLREQIEAGLKFKDILNPLVVVGFFFKSLLCLSFYYSIFLVSAHVCGTGVIYVLLSLFLSVLPFGFTLLADEFVNYYIIGISKVFDYNILKYTTPIFISDNKPSIGYFISYLILILIIFAVSYFCNNIRKQEKTGDSVVFKSIKNILIFLLSISGMFLGRSFFLYVYHNIFIMYFGMIIGFIITYYIAQMFAEKSFNIFLMATKNLYKYVGVTLALFFLLLSVVKFDLFGYVRYVPKTEDVESVSLLYSIGVNEDTSITDIETIEQITKVHQNIIKHENEVREIHLDNRNYRNRIYLVFDEQQINYKLKNGKVITRTYNLSTTLAKETGLLDLYTNDKVILSQYKFLNNVDNIKSIKAGPLLENKTIDNPNYSYISDYIEDKSQIPSLVEEIKKDLITNGVFMKFNYEALHGSTKDTLDKELPLKFDYKPYNSYPNGINIRLTTYENTKKWLLDNGYGRLFE